MRIYFVQKHEVSQAYGGSEEGGWWFDTGIPAWKYSIPVPFFEELAYKLCRFLNEREHKRADRDEDYGYTSVLSHRSTHYSYGLGDKFVAESYPSHTPHYE